MDDVTAKLAAWIEEAVEYVNSETRSPSLEREGRALLAAYEAAPASKASQTVYQLSPTDIYDFAGWLTTRKVSMQVGSSHEAAQMAEAVGEYLKTYPERFAAPVAQAEQWQPIETAPKDGSTIMLWERYESEPFFGYWWEGRSRWRASTTHYDTDGNACVIDRIYNDGVTHWMPLPQPPKEQA